MTKTKLIALVTLIITVGVMVSVAIGTSLWGAELHSLEIEINKLEEANKTVEEQIVGATSLTELYESHEALGFVKPQRVLYLSDNTSVAQAR